MRSSRRPSGCLDGIVDQVGGLHGGQVAVKAATRSKFWEQQLWKEMRANGETEVTDAAGYQVMRLWGRPGWRDKCRMSCYGGN